MTNDLIVQKWLNSIPEAKGILKNIQESGKQCVPKIGFPTHKEEDWKLTNLKRLSNILELNINTNKETNHQIDINNLPNPGKDYFRILLKDNGNPQDKIKFPKGIEPLTDSEIEKSIGQTLEECQCHKTWPIAINNSSINQILAFKVNENNLPGIEIIIPANSKDFNSKRILIHLEDNAELNLLEVILGSESSAQSHIIEIVMGKNSKLNHGLISLGGNKKSNLLSHIATQQKENSEYSFTFIQEGWNLSRLEPRVVQTSGNAKTNLKGLQICNNNDQIATHSFVKFNGPNGELDQLQKAIANDQSHSIFNGVIEVPQIAQQTKAAQLSRNLILSKRAQIDTKPQLEIIADDVRCSHGATISQLQEEEIFYLRSRGINNESANALLLKGFCQEILKNLPCNSTYWTANFNDLIKGSE